MSGVSGEGGVALEGTHVGEAYVCFVLIPYALTCVANILCHLRRGRESLHAIWNLVPLAAVFTWVGMQRSTATRTAPQGFTESEGPAA